jgi:predicted phage terminase large subunit-like protein
VAVLGLTLTLPKIDTGPFNFAPRPVVSRTAEREPFRAFVERVNPTLLRHAHVVKLIAVLQRVADGEIDRLMVFEPPRHFKSETVCRLFSAYYLMRNPQKWVGLNSYAAELAYTLSRNARDNFGRGGGDLSADKTGVEHWETAAGGGLWAAGVGGPITGKGFHLGIIDDPVKNSEDAASETIREKQKEWYRSTFYTRAEPDAAIIVIQTRWHEDDLSGWLLSEEGSEDDAPERWHIVSLPAIAEPPQEFPATCTVERDERADGEALCPERYPLERLERIAKRVGSYFFGALFQQRPRAREGGMFQRGWFQIVAAAPRHATRVRYWDKAGTEGAGAYTCGAKVARDANGVFYVEDMVRGQWEADVRESTIRQSAELDGTGVSIGHEQEPGSSGKESAQATTRGLAGYSVWADKVTGDKVLRAEPLAAQAAAGNVRIVRGAWNAAFLDEASGFPRSKYKDQIDAASGAFTMLSKPERKRPRSKEY